MAKRSRKQEADSAGIPAGTSISGTLASQPTSGPNRDWLFGGILALAVILAYLPVWWSGYVWDDAALVTANPCIVGPLGFKEIWTTSFADICPLVLSTFWLEHALWGLAPLPYHLVNLLLHIACAMTLWRVLLSLQVPGGWLGATLWALHPLQVESVAWIAEMKNTESCLFYLLGILFFVKWLRSEGSDVPRVLDRNYALTLLFAALAMASKSSTVILPIILCLCAWWVRGLWPWRDVLKIGPIFLMSVVAGLISIWTQKINGAIDPQLVRSWPERLVTAGDAVWFYLGKLIWPYPLMTVYPRGELHADNGFSYMPLVAVVVLLGVLWFERNAWARPCFFAFAYFLVALLPVLGLVDNYIFSFSLVFDHLQYLAGMGPLALVAAGIIRLTDSAVPTKPWLFPSLCGAFILVLGTLTLQRARAFESEETLWTDTLFKNPESWLAHNNLGNALFNRGQVDDAINQFQMALDLHPNYDSAHNNLGTALLRKGQVDDAIAQFQKAVEINPTFAGAHNNLGKALSTKGLSDQAMAEYQKAEELNPNDAPAFADLGDVLLQKGQVEQAMANYQKALEIDPNNSDANNNVGFVLAQQGQFNEAIAYYHKALETDPDKVEALYNLGVALAQTRQLDDAIIEYRKALQLEPGYAEVHNNLGAALAQKGELDEAIAQFREALRLKPGFDNAQQNLNQAEAMERSKQPGSY